MYNRHYRAPTVKDLYKTYMTGFPLLNACLLTKSIVTSVVPMLSPVGDEGLSGSETNTMLKLLACARTQHNDPGQGSNSDHSIQSPMR